MRLTLCEVAPRDGLQNQSRILAPRLRAELVDRLAAAGLRRIEATSFVHPARVPAMAGAEDVVRAIQRDPGVSYSGLVLNERGYLRLRGTELDEVRFALSCSQAFSARNCGCTIEQAAAAAAAITAAARADGRRVSITLMVAFGCPFEGAVAETAVLSLAERMLALGPDELILADTIGVGVPRQVSSLLSALADAQTTLGLHLHDTRNTGVLNAFVALEQGATVLDAAVGGVGGCPFAPGASGNLATEDLVYMLHREGVETGIDLDELISVARWLSRVLGRRLPGHVHTSGTPLLETSKPREEASCATG